MPHSPEPCALRLTLYQVVTHADSGVKVIIDPAALMHVIGTKMDFVQDQLRRGRLWVQGVVCSVKGSGCKV